MFPISPGGPRTDGSFLPPDLACLSGRPVLQLSVANGEAGTDSPVSQDLSHHGCRGRSCRLADVPVSVRVVSRPARTARVFTVGYGMILIVLAVIPRIDAPGMGPSDWVLHAMAYGVLGGLLFASGLGRGGTVQGVVMAVGGATVFGLATEFLQLLIPYRSFEIRDVVADAVGALVVVLVGCFSLKAAGSARWGGT